MQVSLSTNFNRNKNIPSVNSKPIVRTQLNYTPKDNISFGFGLGSLVLPIRGLAAWHKAKQLSKQLIPIQSIIKAPDSNIAKLPMTLASLCNIHNEKSEKIVYEMANYPSVEGIKRLVLKNSILQKISDNSPVNVQAKKDFLYNLLDNGHRIDNYFVREFGQLNDSYYKAFKHELIEKSISSVAYVQKDLGVDDSGLARRALALMETLDEKNHLDYIKEKLPVIANLQNRIFKRLKSGGELYTAFQSNYTVSRECISDLYETDKWAKKLLERTIKGNNFDHVKIAKDLNITEEQTADILADIEAKSRIKLLPVDSDEATQIYIDRISSKFASSDRKINASAPIMIEESNKSATFKNYFSKEINELKEFMAQEKKNAELDSKELNDYRPSIPEYI